MPSAPPPPLVPTERELRDALGALGLLGPAPWPDVKKAYHEALRTTHPDVTGDHRRGAATAGIVAAYRYLGAITDGGNRNLTEVWDTAVRCRPSRPQPTRRDDTPARTGPPVLRIDVPDGDTFVAVHELIARIYPITGVDRSAGMILAMVQNPGFATSQLTAEVVPTGAGTAEVTFTLESLGDGTPPDMQALLRTLVREVF